MVVPAPGYALMGMESFDEEAGGEQAPQDDEAEYHRRMVLLIGLHKEAFEKGEDEHAMKKVKQIFRDEFGIAQIKEKGSKMHLEKIMSLWDELVPNSEEFYKLVVSSGRDAGKAVAALSVRVLRHRRAQYEASSWQDVFNTQSDFWNPVIVEEDLPHALAKDVASPTRLVSRGTGTKPQRPTRETSTLMGTSEYRAPLLRVQMSSHLCKLPPLLESREDVLGENASAHKLTQKEFLHGFRALYECDGEANIFTTPVGQALLQQCWSRARWPFFWQRLLDVAFLAVVIRLSFYSNMSHLDGAKVPDRMFVGVLLGVSSILGLGLALEPLACKCIYGSMRPYKTAWVSFCWMSDFISVSFLICEFWGMGPFGQLKPHIKETALYKHPVFISLVILSKWCQLGVHGLVADRLARNVLPAWVAMRSEVSLTFIAWTLYLVFGTTFSYLALPIGDWTPVWQDNFRLALRRMLKLNIMSDFNMWEMEGVNDVLAPQRNSTGALQEAITHGEQIVEVHNDLRYITLGMGVVFPITLLNVYISMVGDAYTSARQRSRETVGKFKTVSMVRVLMLRLLFERCCTPTEPGEGNKSYWITLPNTLLELGPGQEKMTV